MEKTIYGIEGQIAPELNVERWVDGSGKDMDVPPKIQGREGKISIIYCFQSWCPGCHSRGLPTLQKMVKELADQEDIQFLAIQTVFEGKEVNTFDKLLETQKQYELEIPFGQDEGDASTGDRSNTMYHYRTGGTPWFILVNEEGQVVFNDFHLNADKAIEFFKARKVEA